jgi:hypothetical protein
MKGLFTSLQQTHPPSRPACQMHVSACLLIFGSVCRTFRKAHGRYCSQKLMPRRGTLIPLRGAAVRSPTVDQKLHAAQTHSISTHSRRTPLGSLLFPHLPPPRTGGPAYTGPPQWTSLFPPLIRKFVCALCRTENYNLRTAILDAAG